MNNFKIADLEKYCIWEDKYSQDHQITVKCLKSESNSILLDIGKKTKKDIEYSTIIKEKSEDGEKSENGFIGECIEDYDGGHLFQFIQKTPIKNNERLTLQKKNPATKRILNIFNDKKKGRLLKKLSDLFDTYFNPKISFWDRLELNSYSKCPNHFNQSQRDAFNHALSNNRTTAIIGPPGTGKTTVITEIISAYIKNNKSVLCLSTSHVSVDGIVEKIEKGNYHFYPIRLGNKDKHHFSEYDIENIDDTIEEKIAEHFHNIQLDYLPAWMKSDDVISGKLRKEDVSKNRWGIHECLRNIEKEFFKRKESIKTAFQHLGKDSLNKIVNTENHLFPLFSTQIGFNDIFYKKDEIKFNKYKKGYDVLIIDESSRLSIPEFVLSAMNAKKIILVGDDKQLKMITQEHVKNWVKNGEIHSVLRNSAFDYMLENKGNETIKFLDTQYRMDKSIAKISNELFYKGKIRTGKKPEDNIYLGRYSSRIVWFDIKGEEKKNDIGSSYNTNEIAKTIQLIIELKNDYSIDVENKLSIITFYNAQKSKLQNKIKQELGFEKKVETVDSFQGKENEIIILNMVRTKKFGFIDDSQRINVALTRARSYMFIIGDKGFYKDEFWVGQGMFDLNCIEIRTG